MCMLVVSIGYFSCRRELTFSPSWDRRGRSAVAVHGIENVGHEGRMSSRPRRARSWAAAAGGSRSSDASAACD